MTGLRLNAALAVDVQAVPESLVDALIETLHLHSPGRATEPQLSIDLATSKPQGMGQALVQRDGVSIHVAGPLTCYQMQQALAWCDARTGKGWVFNHEQVNARDFAALVLVPMLGEMALFADLLLVHAAAIGLNKKGLLMPAESGSGKSTLFGHAAIAGWSVLSDDLVWLKPDDAGAMLFPCNRELSPSPCSVSQLRLHTIAFPGIAKASGSRPAEFDERLKLLVEQAGFSGNRLASATRFRLLVKVAARTPGFVVEAGPSPQENIALLRHLLDE